LVEWLSLLSTRPSPPSGGDFFAFVAQRFDPVVTIQPFLLSTFLIKALSQKIVIS
jgi:hypothetical protein